MKCGSIILSVLAFVVGLAAAWYWFRASQVKPMWFDAVSSEPEMLASAAAGNVASQFLAASEAARLNKLAAILTAIAVFLGTLGNLAGAWPLVGCWQFWAN